MPENGPFLTAFSFFLFCFIALEMKMILTTVVSFWWVSKITENKYTKKLW